ncbi:MAG: hypothetical protein JWM57_1764, partial [Phycisphaerales bacterium]|nr:hypothetical protein [Phycisphaerales bacterium]
ALPISTERPAAPLADAGHGVRNGMGAPGAAADEPARAAEPTAPVPTPADLTPKAPVTSVAVVPPQPQASTNGTTVIVTDNGATQIPAPITQTQTQTQPPAPQAEQPPLVIRTPTDPFSNDPVARVAKQMGEVVVPVNGTTVTKQTTITTKVTHEANTVAGNTTAAREYKAVAGDTLSRLASQLPGGNVKANRDAVVAMNPTLQKDPNKVVSGRTYLLPAAAPAKEVAVAEATEPKIVAPKTTDVKPVDAKSDAKKTIARVDDAKNPANTAEQRIYVVKAGDTLSKIASAELGSKTEVDTIRTLNADKLKGDVIKVNMKLKLPAKVLASASVR